MDVIENRIKDILKHRDQYKYAVYGRNCESLAFYIKTGKWNSFQSNTIPSLYRDIYNPPKLITNACHWILKVVATLSEGVWVLLNYEYKANM